uniref:Signal peptide peptidase n=2 Tax=Ascaris TaxID=6251 RepID=A0A0M3HPL8_ASCLU
MGRRGAAEGTYPSTVVPKLRSAKSAAFTMEYKRFLSVTTLLTVAVLTIYVGCLRSYAIYFFERDAKRVVFLEQWTATVIPVVLSFLLIVSYLSAKRMKLVEEEIIAKKLSHSSQSNADSFRSRKISRSSDLESIHEMNDENQADSTMHSISELSESANNVGGKSYEHSHSKNILRQRAFNERALEELAKETERVNETESLHRSRYGAEDGTPEKVALNDDLLSSHNATPPSNVPLSRKSSEISSHNIKQQRKQSEIYEKIGKFDFLPFSLTSAVKGLEKPSISSLRKDSLFDIVLQLIGMHLPLWLSVLALYITLLELFSMKFYYQFYYHHSFVKLLALVISLSTGLFHELRWTWFVNDVLAVASAYVVIARVQTVSYIAALVFLLGMVIFDLFWMYGIDLFSTVTRDTRAPLMLIVPWGKEGRRESLATLDIIVPGVFLSVLLKFADMYDPQAFYPSFYAATLGLVVTFAIAVYRAKSTPAMVIPTFFSILTSLSSVERPLDLLRFEIKH